MRRTGIQKADAVKILLPGLFQKPSLLRAFANQCEIQAGFVAKCLGRFQHLIQPLGQTMEAGIHGNRSPIAVQHFACIIARSVGTKKASIYSVGKMEGGTIRKPSFNVLQNTLRLSSYQPCTVIAEFLES